MIFYSRTRWYKERSLWTANVLTLAEYIGLTSLRNTESKQLWSDLIFINNNLSKNRIIDVEGITQNLFVPYGLMIDLNVNILIWIIVTTSSTGTNSASLLIRSDWFWRPTDAGFTRFTIPYTPFTACTFILFHGHPKYIFYKFDLNKLKVDNRATFFKIWTKSLLNFMAV